MDSKFLPNNYNGEAITLIAGRGRYPELLTEIIKGKGIPLKLISIKGETDESLIDVFSDEDHVSLHLGKVNQLLKTLKSLESQYVIMAGQIKPTRLFKDLNPDIKLISILAKLKELNAETIFGALVELIDNQGCKVIDARSFLDDHLATEGLMTVTKKKLSSDILEFGVNMAKNIAQLNIGQGIVIKDKTVIAVEAFEGTNKMLKRVGELNLNNLIFFKTIKKNQDCRFDIPVFGLQTLELMKSLNINTAVLENNSVIMIDKPEILKAAEKYKIQLIGFTAE
ncbi:MAG: LpxI family protein [Coraliomargaritaceae bacterium]